MMDEREKQLTAQVDLWRGKFTAFVASVWEMVNIDEPYEYPGQVLNFISQDILDYRQRSAALEAQNAKLTQFVCSLYAALPNVDKPISDLAYQQVLRVAQRAPGLLKELEDSTE